MFARLAIFEYEQQISTLMLPMSCKFNLDVQAWLTLIPKESYLFIYSEVIPLQQGDWIVQAVKSYKGKRSNQRAFAMEQVKKSMDNLQYKEAKWICHRGYGQLNGDEHVHKLFRMYSKQMLGRKLLLSEWQSFITSQLNVNEPQANSLLKLSILHNVVELRSSIELKISKGKATYRCLRCYEDQVKKSRYPCTYCGPSCYYCEACINMGKARSCGVLLIGNYPSQVEAKLQHLPEQYHPKQVLDLAAFSLSDAQAMATNEALMYTYYCLSKRQEQLSDNEWLSRMNIRKKKIPRQFLLWAVTGAGKTEMIFPLVDYMVKLGGRVLLATPRRDVVLELSPRLRKAFPGISIATLYGGCEEKWKDAVLTIATTHQVMRFQQAFDLVIIDELDAFPYHGDERLYRVTEQSCSDSGIRILLSATPPQYLQQQIKSGKLAHVKLPVRYHRFPLPVPKRIITPPIAEQLRKKVIPPSVIQVLQSSLQADAQVFIFLQRIIYTEAYAQLLRSYFPQIRVEATSSKDEMRSEKVMQFRERKIRILVTTTILERGVTVPNSDVYICEAEAALFDEASLVQMAGRAGRSKEHPYGSVYYLSTQWNLAQKRSIKQIKLMNKLAKQRGYLNSES